MAEKNDKRAGKVLVSNKLLYAKKLAESHIKIEGTISGVAYITSAAESNANEPIKLLEINSATSASGFFPITLTPSASIPYPSTLVELTPEEAILLQTNKLKGWPKNWKIGEWLYKKSHKKEKRRI